MFCTKCGENLAADAKFCTSCGMVLETVASVPVQPIQQQYAPPPYVEPNQPFQAPSAPPPNIAPTKKKRHIGCFVVLFIVLAVAAAILFAIAKFVWLGPRDLGIRYTQEDFDSSMKKVGLKVDYKGMNSDQLSAYIDEHEGEKLPLDTYNWKFSDYQEKKFELTPEEATAFANEIAPLLTWFDDVQFKTYTDGSSAGSYKVHFDKIKEELIADVVSQIPSAVTNMLPDTFNLYTEGTFEIKENEIIVAKKLDRLDVGVVPLQPVIGDISDETRSVIYDYVERIYKQIPDLKIHVLKINSAGNFEISAYMPTRVTLTDK